MLSRSQQNTHTRKYELLTNSQRFGLRVKFYGKDKHVLLLQSDELIVFETRQRFCYSIYAIEGKVLKHIYLKLWPHHI